MRLLFTLAHWHGLAKLRLHTDLTLAILDDETTSLGEQLRHFTTKTCAAFKTEELPREAKARKRRQAKIQAGRTKSGTEGNGSCRTKTFNLQTYKYHALGDYVDTIRRYGTTDSYSTEVVSIEFPDGHRYLQ
jgi:hypothetical protein